MSPFLCQVNDFNAIFVLILATRCHSFTWKLNLWEKEEGREKFQLSWKQIDIVESYFLGRWEKIWIFFRYIVKIENVFDILADCMQNIIKMFDYGTIGRENFVDKILLRQCNEIMKNFIAFFTSFCQVL